jgi:hypothetical protein
MTHFYFSSYEPYEVVMHYLIHLNLGILDNLYQVSNIYMACYHKITCPSFTKIIFHDFGENKLIYSENEYGYPLYWKIWW